MEKEDLFPEQNDESSDTDDDVPVNIVGDIPMEWYDEFQHIGYTATGDKVIPKERPDAIDEIIRRSTDPEWWRRIYDQLNGEFKKISAEDLDLIQRIRTGRVALRDYQLYQDYHEKEYEDKIHPLSNFISSKGKFRPSKQTIYRVNKFVAAIRANELREQEEEKEDEPIDIWSEDFYSKPQKRRGRPAPKIAPPLNDDSYNPNGGAKLIEVPGYDKAVRERYDRCCDLYLRPRELRARLPDSSAELLPELPDAEQLKPFPTTESVRFVGHTARVRSVDISHSGSLLVSGSSDGELKIWETQTGFCLRTINLGQYCNDSAVCSVAFYPTQDKSLIGACCGKYVYLIRLRDDCDLPEESETIKYVEENIAQISHPHIVSMRECVFSPTGTFFAVLGQSRHVFIYNTTSWDYRTPITSAKSYIQTVKFHPNKPYFIVATQHHILVFDLIEKVKRLTLRPHVQWVSSVDIHPRGDHILAGAFDGKSMWFDTELSADPFKTLRTHTAAVRDVMFHKRFPLFATCSDDTKIYVFHSQVYDDLITNPLIVPVKELQGHNKNGVLGVLALVWHRTQPWLISAGADHTIRLWT
ncbi:ribosome biogenesis protein BOP1 [Histomonas meleagridis]|uniref:ribosome biogenesis protein BOP1-like n=1 Tax=Histomonas meleagridis TaxID=135588 RepID=UPI00355AB01B|nr:ribosome biogenesis protein BOP1 [Histomonas meleagridis]KAH0796711.1 ribosome biogenesis protein BOP1-like [Histomonas meleagridis]